MLLYFLFQARGTHEWATRTTQLFLAVNLRAAPPLHPRQLHWLRQVFSIRSLSLPRRRRSNLQTRQSYHRKAKPRSRHAFNRSLRYMAAGSLTFRKPIFGAWPQERSVRWIDCARSPRITEMGQGFT